MRVRVLIGKGYVPAFIDGPHAPPRRRAPQQTARQPSFTTKQEEQPGSLSNGRYVSNQKLGHLADYFTVGARAPDEIAESLALFGPGVNAVRCE
jgi:hypothetical protein